MTPSRNIFQQYFDAYWPIIVKFVAWIGIGVRSLLQSILDFLLYLKDSIIYLVVHYRDIPRDVIACIEDDRQLIQDMVDSAYIHQDFYFYLILLMFITYAALVHLTWIRYNVYDYENSVYRGSGYRILLIYIVIYLLLGLYSLYLSELNFYHNFKGNPGPWITEAHVYAVRPLRSLLLHLRTLIFIFLVVHIFYHYHFGDWSVHEALDVMEKPFDSEEDIVAEINSELKNEHYTNYLAKSFETSTWLLFQKKMNADKLSKKEQEKYAQLRTTGKQYLEEYSWKSEAEFDSFCQELFFEFEEQVKKYNPFTL